MRRGKVSLSTKIKAVRLLANENTEADAAATLGVSPRRLRRMVDYLKDKLEVGCIAGLIHALHARGMMWACEDEAKDWLNKHEIEQRKAA